MIQIQGERREFMASYFQLSYIQLSWNQPVLCRSETLFIVMKLETLHCKT